MLSMSSSIKSPEAFFGFQMGTDRKLARWDKIVEYFWHLDESPRVKVMELGKSTMGNPFLLSIISSPENLENLERIREISWRIAHPQGLSESDARELVVEGKTVVSQTMSVHASEVGGTQMAPELAYEMATSDDPEMENIRKNTILLLFPCLNPDGNIMEVDWYNGTLGTEYEGARIPYLYHKYVGHDNNRDMFHMSQAETRLVVGVIFREWYPQAQLDFHHTGSYGCRFSIPPKTDPLYEHVDPLVWAEQQLFGGLILTDLEAAGKTGVETQATYPGHAIASYTGAFSLHNIIGMITESASAKSATPIYIHYQQLEPARRGRPEYRTQMNFPHPWPGGWWRLRDIVEQQKIAAIATLKVAASFRKRILWNMYLKAKRQIDLGKSEPPSAFIVSPKQHDRLTMMKFLRALQAQDVEVHHAKEDFEADGLIFPKDTYVIFTAQNCRPYILRLLNRTFIHDGPFTRKPDGTPQPPDDMSTGTLVEFMGVKVIEALKPIKGCFEVCEPIQYPKGKVEDSEHGHIFDGRLNESYVVVNHLLKSGVDIFRVLEPRGELPVGAFYIPSKDGVDDILKESSEHHHVTFHAVDNVDFAKKPVKQLRIGLYRRYWGGSMDEGWNRWLFEKYGFEYETLWDNEIREGNLAEKFDVIVIPNDPKVLILGENLEEYYGRRNRKAVVPKYPKEYRSGIGKDGVDKLREFIESGGTVVTLGEASDFAIEELNLPISNVVKGMSPKEFFCPGSTINTNIDTNHPYAYGVDEKPLIFFQRNSAVFELKQSASNQDYKVVVRYPGERVLQSGWLIGEKHLSRKAALIDARLGEGHVVLFGFSPQFRAMTDGTFKLFFNCLLG